MTFLKNISRQIGIELGLIYVPDDWCVPAPNQGAKKMMPTKGKSVVFDDVVFNRKTGRHYRVKHDKEVRSAEWSVVDKPTNFIKNADKLPTLTPFDVAVLDDKRINGRSDIKYSDEKAALIKEYWFKEIPRIEAAKDLKVRTGEKGFSEDIVKIYYAIFNKAMEFQQASPIEENKGTTHD